MSEITLRVVADTHELNRLKPVWERLAALSPAANPMLEPLWLTTWWEHYAKGRELRVGVAEAGETVVGLVPLCLRTQRYGGALPFRRLEMMGSSGGDEDALCSEYLDILAQPGCEDSVIAATVAALTSGRFGPWDEIVLEATSPDSLAARLAETLGRENLPMETASVDQAPVMVLPQDWSEFLASLPKKRRQGLGYAVRDFEAWAEQSGWQLNRATDAGTLHTGLDVLMSLHEERWRADGEGGVFSSNRFRGFHETYARRALENGRIDLAWITVGGRAVAAQYNLVGRDTVYFYQCGRTLDVPKKVRLGIVMLIFSIKHAIAGGFREFDFLGGDSSYKQEFATTTRELKHIRIARRSTAETMLQSLKGARDLVRRTRAALSQPKSE